ncbi:hypothetical protein KY289_031170 [Solanum tuberosum]|nr:hypothetical protein KY289_031170 [Solanum tuberosum]
MDEIQIQIPVEFKNPKALSPILGDNIFLQFRPIPKEGRANRRLIHIPRPCYATWLDLEPRGQKCACFTTLLQVQIGKGREEDDTTIGPRDSGLCRYWTALFLVNFGWVLQLLVRVWAC